MPNKKSAETCPICAAASDALVTLNPSNAERNKIEVALNRNGILMARSLGPNRRMIFQEILEVPFCPLCGRKFKDR